MREEYFVNMAFEESIKKYLASKSDTESLAYNTSYVVVIRLLALIYGKLDIINPYYLKNSIAFISIQKYLVDMFVAKKKTENVSLSEEETFLELIYSSHTKNYYRISYNYFMSDDPNFIEKYYYSKLNEMDVTKELTLDKTITGDLNLEALNLLGINLSNLKNMSNAEIKESQNKAYEYFEVDAESPNREEDLNKAVDYYKLYGKKITTGNGYVDILLLMSVIVTSLSVISIIIFSII